MASFIDAGSPLPHLLLVLCLFFFCSRLSLAVLVSPSPLHVSYHNGPILSGAQPLKLLLTFYGHFEPSERATLKDFVSSLTASRSEFRRRRSLRTALLPVVDAPSVSSWWSITRRFSDLRGLHVSETVAVEKEMEDLYSLGRRLTASDMAVLARRSANGESANFLSVIFTAADVLVDGFCMHSCGGHSHTDSEIAGESIGATVPYVWVGNSESQCPGYCAWPFAKPQYGPDMPPLKAPNGVGVDGMIISLAKLLVGAATNPFGNAFYEGDEDGLKREAGGMCPGVFGTGAYPGFPGEVLQNAKTGSSYNMEGIQGRQFLVPWIWNPASQSCAGQA